MGSRIIGLTNENQVEIISAYSAPEFQIPAVEDEPGWYVIGGFHLPVSSSAMLDVIGLVSEDGLTLSARLFDLNTNAVVSGSLVEITGTFDTRALSGSVELTGNRLFQIQAQVVGPAVDGFGILKTATLT